MNGAERRPSIGLNTHCSLAESAVGVPVLLVVLFLAMRVVRRSTDESNSPFSSDVRRSAHSGFEAGPPLPAEGLPPGWTMEQWATYGEDYLNNR